MSRLKYNLEILKILEEYIVNNPDIRFGQALYNLNITRTLQSVGMNQDDPTQWCSEFYTESKDTLERLR